jgi:hypothetical protein
MQPEVFRMRLVLGFLALVLIAGPAFAADMAKSEGVVIEGVYTPHQNDFDASNPGSALVASIIAGTFTDQAPAYQGALVAAGESPVDLLYDPMGVWPALGGYTSVTVTCSDLWWAGYFLASDEAVLASYVAGGGCLFLIGQDYIYQRGSYAGFPTDTFGIGYVYEDANYGDTFLEYVGTAGGPIDGLSGSGSDCFGGVNQFFTDDITPTTTGLATWTSATWGPAEGGAVLNKAAFSTVEFACMNNLNAVVAGLLGLCGGPVPTQETTWGAVKGMFR